MSITQAEDTLLVQRIKSFMHERDDTGGDDYEGRLLRTHKHLRNNASLRPFAVGDDAIMSERVISRAYERAGLYPMPHEEV